MKTLRGLSDNFLWTFRGLSEDFPRTFWGLSRDVLRTFWGLSKDFLRALWWLSENFLWTFRGLSEDFLRTFWGLSDAFLRTFRGHLVDFLGEGLKRLKKLTQGSLWGGGGRFREVNILSKFQVSSSNGLGVMMFWSSRWKGWLTYLINWLMARLLLEQPWLWRVFFWKKICNAVYFWPKLFSSFF